MMSEPDLSVVVPVLNEEDNIDLLVESVREALTGWGGWELIFVDDGSDDATAQSVRRHAARDSRVRLVRLARRYGQSTAMQAGFDHAQADVVVTMDGDLQNDPRDIPTLVSELNKGFDLVAGYREKRKDPFLTRKVPSWVANRIIAVVSGVSIRDNGCSLKAYRRTLLDRVRLYSDLHRFIPALAAGTAGARISEVPVRHHARVHGRSKYGLSRIAKVFADLLTVKMIRSFRLLPLRLFGGAGLVSCALGVLFLALSVRVQGPSAGGDSPSLVYAGVSILCFGLFMFLILLGLVGQSAVSLTYRSGAHQAPLVRELRP